MKVSKLINELAKLSAKHGDVEVYTRYDSGCLSGINKVGFRKKISWNEYSEYSNVEENVIVIFDHD